MDTVGGIFMLHVSELANIACILFVSVYQMSRLFLLCYLLPRDNMDRKFDISVVVSAFPLAAMHPFIFVVPVIYLKMLCHLCCDPFLSPHPYILLHVSVTSACYY